MGNALGNVNLARQTSSAQRANHSSGELLARWAGRRGLTPSVTQGVAHGLGELLGLRPGNRSALAGALTRFGSWVLGLRRQILSPPQDLRPKTQDHSSERFWHRSHGTSPKLPAAH